MGGSRAHLDKKNWKIVQKQSFASVQFVPICPLWCSNIKSKIGVGRHAVSCYHQLKKFFIAGGDPDYRDHDFPTPGYLICLSGYMVIQHPQSGNTQDASGRNNVKFGHTGPLGLERNDGRVCLVTLRYSHILICRFIIDMSTSIWTWHNVLMFCLDCMMWCACSQHFIPYSVILW